MVPGVIFLAHIHAMIIIKICKKHATIWWHHEVCHIPKGSIRYDNAIFQQYVPDLCILHLAPKDTKMCQWFREWLKTYYAPRRHLNQWLFISLEYRMHPFMDTHSKVRSKTRSRGCVSIWVMSENYIPPNICLIDRWVVLYPPAWCQCVDIIRFWQKILQ